MKCHNFTDLYCIVYIYLDFMFMAMITDTLYELYLIWDVFCSSSMIGLVIHLLFVDLHESVCQINVM